jgi:transposase
MAYEEHGMQEIIDVLRRVHRGESVSAIARVSGRSRSTVQRWTAIALELGWTKSVEPDETLAIEVLRRSRPGRPPEKSETSTLLEPHRERVREWLRLDTPGSRGLSLVKIHRLLARDGVSVPYSSLHRWAVSELGFSDKRRITVRVADVAPGEVAEVDYGRLGPVFDRGSERRRLAWALVVTLAHSRHVYVHVGFSQTVGDLVDGLESAWEFFGGVPARVVLDNLKAAVSKPDRYDPYFQRTFDEYAHYRGFVIDAAPVRMPTGKPHVERSIQYLRDSFFLGETWLDLEHVQRDAIRWCREVAGLRVHGTTRLRPLEVFEALERAALRPIARDRFDPPVWARCKVHPDHHIIFAKALYSVPTRYVGTEVEVRADRGLVRVFARGELIKTHPRQRVGGRATDYDDYPKQLAPYAMRDPDRMIADARHLGEHIGRFMTELLAGPLPWARLRQAQKLLRLAARHGRDALERSCARALAFGLVDVRRVERIVLQGLDRLGQQPERSTPAPVITLPRFLRSPKSFVHDTTKEKNRDGDQAFATHDPEETSAVGHPADAAGPHRSRTQDQDE